MSALRYMIRASARRCHSPPDRSWPPSNSRPTFASSPFGIFLSSHSLRASCSASSTRSSSTAPPGRPMMHVLADRQLVAGVVLEQHADPVAQHFGVDGLDVDAADAHRALVGVVEAQQQLDQRALPCAVLADQRDQLAVADVQIQALHRRLGPARVL